MSEQPLVKSPAGEPLVAVAMGSDSDLPTMRGAIEARQWMSCWRARARCCAPPRC